MLYAWNSKKMRKCHELVLLNEQCGSGKALMLWLSPSQFLNFDALGHVEKCERYPITRCPFRVIIF